MTDFSFDQVENGASWIVKASSTATSESWVGINNTQQISTTNQIPNDVIYKG
jgi:hypothetical protein